jgi:uncharacterized protein (TIGR03437 family)
MMTCSTLVSNVTVLSLLITAALAQGPGGPPNGGDGIWRRNAYYGELLTFDACVGHQPGTGQYHYHANPLCLRWQLNDNLEFVRNSRTGPHYVETTGAPHHSPILGWALDGYPIYGPYGYLNPKDATSAPRRVASGFRLRNLTVRTTLPDWSLPNHPNVSQSLATSQYGPAVSTTFPLGRYDEDYEWVSGQGDLDQYNGRFTVTPEFPDGTYAYYVTIDSGGSPAFPYILSGQFHGATGSFNNQVPATTTDYFNSGTFSMGPRLPALTSWSTTYSNQFARTISGFDPSAGPATTWPSSNLLGVRTSGSVTSPVLADTQRIRYTDSTVYVSANGLAGYPMGPWFSADMTGGVFFNFPSANPATLQMPRVPSESSSKVNTGGGPQGLWVNGVAVFNFIDGASYINSTGLDGMAGNTPAPDAAIASAASFEQGPIAPGSLVTATPLYFAVLASSVASAATADWPVTLAGAGIVVTDAAGTSASAQIFYASPSQLNFRIPEGMSSGAATVTITTSSQTIRSNINIQSTYPNLFLFNANALAAGTLTRVHNGVTTTEQIYSALNGTIVAKPVALNGDLIYLTLYGSGLGAASTATATIGNAAATVLYAGPQGTYKGLDQFNLSIPPTLAGAGMVDIVITAGGKPSNAVNIAIQ